jgi:hypothetical protein
MNMMNLTNSIFFIDALLYKSQNMSEEIDRQQQQQQQQQDIRNLLDRLNNPEYGLHEDKDIVKKDLIKFYIYRFTIQKYPKFDAELRTTNEIINNNWYMNLYRPALEDLVRRLCYTNSFSQTFGPNDATINQIYELHTNPPPPFSLPTRPNGGGGHKSARRVKSKSARRVKSKSARRVKSKSIKRK